MTTEAQDQDIVALFHQGCNSKAYSACQDRRLRSTTLKTHLREASVHRRCYITNTTLHIPVGFQQLLTNVFLPN